MPAEPPDSPEVADLRVSSETSVAQLVAGFSSMGGFTSRRLAQAAQVLGRVRADGARVVLSFPAAVMATGLRGVITDLVRDGYVHAVITTCGTWDHDLARTWGAYHHGDFQMDDADLHARGVHRLGNVLVPASSYGELLETELAPRLKTLFSSTPRVSTRVFSAWLGGLLDGHESRSSSLLWVAKEANVPVFVPGPTDGAVGSQVWMQYQQNREIGFDLMRDEQDLADFFMAPEPVAGLIVGGGISKHHLIWWAQFRDGLDYAVAITTARESDGSLSGARLREAVSWGKLKSQAAQVTVDGDATMVLPLLVASWRASTTS